MDNLIGREVYLTSRSPYGRETIQESGSSWIIIDYKDSVLGLMGKPGYCIESLLTKNWRWIAKANDKNFYWSLAAR